MYLTQIVWEEEYTLATEYTYTYKREYDSTFRSRYEKARVEGASIFDAASALNYELVVATAAIAPQIVVAQWALLTALDNLVKLLPYPQNPKKIVYHKVSEQKQVTRTRKLGR